MSDSEPIDHRAGNPESDAAADKGAGRSGRLKAALKANIARRKQQARARAAHAPDDDQAGSPAPQESGSRHE